MKTVDRPGNPESPFAEVEFQSVQHYWNARPCNIRHSVKQIGTREYFDEVEQRKYFVEPHIKRFAEFGTWKGKRVLEIGCGIGTDTINFARAGAVVTAVDCSEASLEIARKRAQVFGCAIEFHQANAEELSARLPVETYDLVYSFGVIHHTPHPARAMAEIRKYMGRESLLKIMVYNRMSWKVLRVMLEQGKGAFWNIDRIIARNSEAESGCPVTYTYSKKTVRTILDGMEIMDMWVDHIFPYKIHDYVRYRYKKEWYFALLPRPCFRWLEHHFGWHLCVTAKCKADTLEHL
jgi:2-polyprenyl-3-methyl-5-hydroxy-6-metoxy-1,4-benzoquinol methylase